MERKYYAINERNAKIAHDLSSMSDYVAGSTEREYRKVVDQAYDLAEKVEQKRPDDAERAYWLAEQYARKMAQYYNRESAIGMICPSVMVSGAGNFPVKKKERQIAAWDSNHKFYESTQEILSKIENILYGKEVIKSGDARAIEKLEQKLEDMREEQKRMKAANKAVRLKNTEEGDDQLREMGYSEADIAELRKPDFLGRVGFPNYMLTNNNANIHRTEERLEKIKAAKEAGSSEHDYGSFKVIENADLMRYQILFDGKPDNEVRSVLKDNGFMWSPSNVAWQRQMTTNGRYALERAVEKLKKLEKIAI